MTLLLSKIVTNLAKVFSFRKIKKVAVCRIHFILLVSFAYDLMLSILPLEAAPSMLNCI